MGVYENEKGILGVDLVFKCALLTCILQDLCDAFKVVCFASHIFSSHQIKKLYGIQKKTNFEAKYLVP